MYRHKKQAKTGWWATWRHPFLHLSYIKCIWWLGVNNIPTVRYIIGCKLWTTFVLNLIFFHGFLHKCPRVNKLNVILRFHCWGQYNARAIAVAIVVVFALLSMMLMAAEKRSPLVLFQQKLWQMIINNLMILSIIYSLAFSVDFFNLFTLCNSLSNVNYVE